MSVATTQQSEGIAKKKSRTGVDTSYGLNVEQESALVTEQVLNAVVELGESLVIVSASPGAGKTWLIETLTCVLVNYGLRVGVITPRYSQMDALLDRLLTNYPTLAPVQVLQSAQRDTPPCIARHPGRTTIISDAQGLRRGSGVVLATADKLFHAMPSMGWEYDVLICDEAWQLSYHTLAPLLGAARQTVLIGDPAQLSPLVRTNVAPYEIAAVQVHKPGPETLLERYPRVTHIRLPYSRRLTKGAVDLIQPTFYPQLPFRAATTPSERRLALSGRSTGSAVDRVIDLLGDGASIVSLLLPRRTVKWSVGVDNEMAQLEASLVRRLLDRKARWVGNWILKEEDIGCINSRVKEGAALRRYLRSQRVSTSRVWTDTAEAWQGLERQVILARHPASGLSRLSDFDLEIGRFCVMLTRSSLCTILTYRAGLMEALQAHSHDCGSRELGQDDTSYRGWSAHLSLLAALESRGWIVRM